MLREFDNKSPRLAYALGFLPPPLLREIMEVARSVDDFVGGISEVRVRRYGSSSLVIRGSVYPLFRSVSEIEMRELVERLTSGALYLFRESIGEGYISVGRGVRVGVAGVARYEEGRLVGVDDISSLVFRIPRRECDFGDRLYREWVRSGARNMLVASPPMGGKTTALRSLARYIGTGEDRRRVVVVDERCEFDPEDYTGADVDLLRGYKRERGIELAVRTMSAEVIITDEVATLSEAEALLLAAGTGVSVISGVHLDGIDRLGERACLSPLVGGFPILAQLYMREGRLDFDFHATEVAR